MFNRIKIYFRMKTYNLRKRIQRFIRGYAYSDVWDIDAWFMENIKPMLIHLRDHGMGIPMDLYQEDAENEREKWEAVLTEMINCLNNMDDNKVKEQFGTDTSFGFKALSRQDYLDMHEIMEKNKNRFFELFSKYFYTLLD